MGPETRTEVTEHRHLYSYVPSPSTRQGVLSAYFTSGRSRTFPMVSRGGVPRRRERHQRQARGAPVECNIGICWPVSDKTFIDRKSHDVLKLNSRVHWW